VAAAEVALGNHDYDEAEREAQQALEFKPGDEAAADLLSRAREAMRTQAYEAAVAEAQSACDHQKYDLAEQHANQALLLRPADATARELLSRAQKGKIEESLRQAEIKAAEEALGQEDYEGAEQHAKQALELRRADATARELVSRAQEGKRQESLRQAEIKAAEEALGQEDYE